MQINLAILLWHCHMVTAIPGIVDSPELRKSREIGSKHPSLNAIVPVDVSSKPVNDFQPMRLTLEDVVTGSNSVYGSQFGSQFGPQFSSGGIIFAISGGQSSQAPLMSTGLFCNNAHRCEFQRSLLVSLSPK
jgi:hypothetical protein